MATHHPTLQLGPDDHGRAVTAGEFAEAEFVEPWTYERVDGRLVVMAPDGERHVEGTGPWLKRLVQYWIDHSEIVDRVVPNAWVRIDGGTDRIGDLGVYLVNEAARTPIPDRAPDLMFEVVSPGAVSTRRDHEEKRADYSKRGIAEYVVIDRHDQTVTVFTRGPKGYRKKVLNAGGTYTTPLLPGLRIPLADVL